VNDQGFNGAGSRFGSRFEAGSPILAKQLNDLASGLQASLPMPYLGDGSIVSYTPGGSLITKTDNETKNDGAGNDYYNQFKCVVNEEEAEGGGTLWTLQIVSGSIIYGDEHQATQEAKTSVDEGSPVPIHDGGDPNSGFTNNGGYCTLDEGKDYGVYLFLIHSNDRKKFISYLYVADTTKYNWPATDFVATQPLDIPDALSAPFTAYTFQVLEIAFITWNPDDEVFELNQELIGSQTFPNVFPPDPFQIDVINTEKDIEADPVWIMRIAKGSVLSAPDNVGECIGHDFIIEIDPRCNPEAPVGFYPDSPFMNLGSGYPVTNDTDYSVWLFNVVTSTDGVNLSENIFWVGPSSDYTDVCPVVLPANVTPTGDYVAQSIHIGDISQPTSADVWVVEQIVQGNITVPSSIPDVCVPFKVRKYSTVGDVVNFEVCEGTVNNVIPDNIDDTFEIPAGESIWLKIGHVDGEVFPDSLTIEFGMSVPPDDDDFGYVKLARWTGTVINQYVTGSLSADRIKLGDNTATYYYSRI
jgi:hypothetical protein